MLFQSVDLRLNSHWKDWFLLAQVTLAGAEMTGQLQTFAFDEPIEAESVRITTLSVYSTYNNGYAEVAFFGKKVAQEN